MSRRLGRIVPAVGLLGALLSSQLAGQATVDTAASIQAATQVTLAWLTLIDEGRFAESWDEAATPFQKALTREAWQQAVWNARQPLEPFDDRQQLTAKYTTQVPNAPPGQYVLFQFQTRVAGGRTVIETVVPVLDGDRGWRVSGYFVRPKE